MDHLRVKTVTTANYLNETEETQISIEERVTQLESELKAATTLIQQLVAQ